MSLSSNKEKKGTSRLASGQNSVVMSQRPSYNNLLEAKSKKNSSANLAQDFKERKKERKLSQSKPAIQESVAEDCPSEKAPQDLKEEEKRLLDKQLLQPIVYPNEKDVLKTAAKKLAEYKHIKETEEQEEKQKQIIANGGGKDDPPKKKISFWRKVAIFFDFDLLKDKTYVNLMLGLTIANFVEINFSILTPFVLKEFDFEKYQVSTFMSLLGATDIVVRFFIPFVADRLGWQNKTFFMIGVLMMAAGRISKFVLWYYPIPLPTFCVSSSPYKNIHPWPDSSYDHWLWQRIKDDFYSVGDTYLRSSRKTACSFRFAISFKRHVFPIFCACDR